MDRFKASILVILSLIPLTLVHLGVALSAHNISFETGSVSFIQSLPYTGMVFIYIIVLIVFISSVANYFLVLRNEKIEKERAERK
ncbi:MAG: hypothetical protein RR565_04940 [Erysipelothrix sp.]